MYKNAKIVVVVPCYNEETQIAAVVHTMPDYVDKIIIIDDVSKDKTVEVVEGLMASDDRVMLIKHEVNQGVGGAIASGYMWARDNDYDAAVVMAGDGQMNPDDMPDLLDPVVADESDYTKGNRLVYQDAYQIIPRVRFLGNSMLSLLTKIASGYWHVADSQTGYTVIARKPLEIINWDHMYKRYGQPNDLLIKLNVHSFRVRDVPIMPVYDIGEKSGIRYSSAIFRIGALLLKGFFWRLKEKYVIRDFHPLVFFYLFGMIFLLVSLGFLYRVIALWIEQGEAPILSVIAMMFAVGFGFQSIMFAMWMDRDDNRHLR